MARVAQWYKVRVRVSRFGCGSPEDSPEKLARHRKERSKVSGNTFLLVVILMMVLLFLLISLGPLIFFG